MPGHDDVRALDGGSGEGGDCAVQFVYGNGEGRAPAPGGGSDRFPVREEGLLDWGSGGGVGDSSEDEEDGGGVLIVNIGGGHGQDLQKFASAFPDASGRLVNQELPGVLAEIPSGGGSWWGGWSA